MDAEVVVGLLRCGAEPEVVVEFRRDGLRLEAGVAGPVESFQLKPVMPETVTFRGQPSRSFITAFFSILTGARMP